jgi:hypothetical protein
MVELPMLSFLGARPLNFWLKCIVVFFIYGYASSGLFKIFWARDKPHFKKIYKRSTFISLLFFFVFGTIT